MNAEDLHMCRHEALHAVAAWTYGQHIDRLARGSHGAITWWTPDPDDWAETAVVLLIPFLDNPKGCGNEMMKVRHLVDAGKVLLSHVWTKASLLLADPQFRRRVRGKPLT